MALWIKNAAGKEDYKGLVFIHTPKTGGSFLRDMFHDLEYSTDEIREKHSYRNQLGISSFFTPRFAFVRQPFEWYLSFWGKKIKKFGYARCEEASIKDPRNLDPVNQLFVCNDPDASWHPTWSLELTAWDVDLKTFLNNVCERTPGFYTEMIDQFTGHISNINPIEKVYTYENFNNSVISLFEDFSIDTDISRVKEILNDKDRSRYSAKKEYKNEMIYLTRKEKNYFKDKINELEHRVLDTFYK